MGCAAAHPVVSAEIVASTSPDSKCGFEILPEVRRNAEEVAFHEKYQLGSKLGRGAFAQVRVAAERAGVQKDEVAVKIINLHGENDKADEVANRLQKTSREAGNWRKVAQHPNCVGLYDVFLGGSFSYMVMEKCDKGLFQALEALPDMTERGFGKIIAEMLLGIAHCHSCNLLHRDIKPDNFLVGCDNAVKLADFGFSTVISSQNKATGIYGTAPFMCPEMLNGEQYDGKADVWSLAVVVYALLFGCFPYTPTKDASATLTASRAMKRAIRIGTLPSFTPSTKIGTSARGQMRSDAALKVVKTLLNRNPAARPSAEEALRMHWMADSLRGQHLLDEDLPSLRPMLYAAKKNGAFELRDSRKASPDDVLLRQLQTGSSKATDHSDDVDMPAEKPIEGICQMGASKATSHSPDRKPSKVDWETASTRSTRSGSSSLSRGGSEQIIWSRQTSEYQRN